MAVIATVLAVIMATVAIQPAAMAESAGWKQSDSDAQEKWSSDPFRIPAKDVRGTPVSTSVALVSRHERLREGPRRPPLCAG
jgi:hypothetical protein